MSKIIVLGASGHAHVIIDILQLMGICEIVGVLASGAEASDVLGVPILGGDDLLPGLRQQGIAGAIVAIGDNRVRRKVFDRVVAAGLEPINAIHPAAVIARSTHLGRGIVVMAGAVINPSGEIGDNAIINTGATIDHHARIGADVHIAPGCHLAGNVTVGAQSFLGTGVCVIPKITIGKQVIVGAGTTIFRDVPDRAKVVGAPMRYLDPGLESV